MTFLEQDKLRNVKSQWIYPAEHGLQSSKNLRNLSSNTFVLNNVPERADSSGIMYFRGL